MTRLVVIETSQRLGRVALASDTGILAERRLDEARRHARDLAPVLAELLGELGWTPRDLTGVFVSRGPGSYTGLRVGLMSAKTLAYALGCPLLGIDTFHALARQAQITPLEVIADAQQGKVYAQRFTGSDAGELRIVPFTDWSNSLPEGSWVTGPGMELFRDKLPETCKVVAPELWTPTSAALLALGLERTSRNERDDPLLLEPLYLRPSSAEENWQRKSPGGTG